MHPGSVVAGASFRTAMLALLCFIAVLTLTGTLLHRRTAETMHSELEDQIVEELELFRAILERGGRPALVDAIRQLEEPAVAVSRLSAVFDADGRRLAGPLDIAPDYVGWRDTVLRNSGATSLLTYRVRVEKWNASTIVVGRSTRLIERTLDALIVYLVAAGLAVSATTFAIGYALSRSTRDRLDHVVAVMDRIGRGDMRARIGPRKGSDQIARVSQQIDRQLDALAAVMEQTRNTIGAIAHDLRTPLNRASLRLQAAEAAVADNPVALDAIDEAHAELVSLGNIFETTLRIGRIRASEDRSTFKSIDVAALLADLHESFEPLVNDAGSTLELTVDPSMPLPLGGDVQMLSQLLANLIQNAMVHAPDESTITLGAERNAAGGTVLFVSDQGPGIPPNERERVLEPFVRLDTSRTRPGSGLGLAMVDAVVRHHAARLTLEDNQPGLRACVAFAPSIAEETRPG